MKALLREYEFKRVRARHHFDALREAVDGFTNHAHEAVRGEFDGGAGGYVFRVPLDPIDPNWTLLLGDCVYNTRASLDYLITALIISAGNEEHETSQFPIVGIDRRAWHEIDEWWEKDPSGTIMRHLRGTPAGTKAALKTLQPFYGVPRVDPWRHPLFALQTLSNRDKHRRLNVVVRGVLIRFEDAAGQPIFHGPPPHARISEDHDRDTYTVALAVRAPLGQEVHLVPAYDVRLQEPPHLFGALIATLSSINEFIDAHVLPTVRGLMAP